MNITSPIPLNNYLQSAPICSNNISLFIYQPPDTVSIQSFQIIYKETDGTTISFISKLIFIKP